MGLDFVEIVMEVEEAFNIKIRDDDVVELRTVGDFQHYICAQFEAKKSQRCASTTAFLRLRRALMAAAGIDRKEIRLESSVPELVPSSIRRSVWNQIEAEMEMRLPELRRPGWLSFAFFFSSILAFVSFLVALITFGDPSSTHLWWVLLLSIMAICMAYRATLPFATCLGDDCATIRGMTKKVLEYNIGKIMRSDGIDGQASDVVYQHLVNMLSEQLGIPKDKIRPDSSIVDDLGCC